MIDLIMDRFIPVVIGLLALSMIALLVIWLPAHLMHEIECLEKGFPVAKTTITLDGYCMNTEGAVTAVVEKL